MYDMSADLSFNKNSALIARPTDSNAVSSMSLNQLTQQTYFYLFVFINKTRIKIRLFDPSNSAIFLGLSIQKIKT